MKTTLRILVVDAEEASRTAVAGLLDATPHSYDLAQTPEEGLAALSKGTYDLIIFDIWSDTMPGFSLFEKAKQTYEFIEGIVITGAVSIYSVLDSYRMGLFDFIIKPFPDGEELLAAVEGVARKRSHWLDKMRSLDYQQERI